MRIRKFLSSTAAVTALCTAGPALAEYDQFSSDWYTDAQSQIAAVASQPLNTNQARNVIIFLGDGMGVSTITAGRILQGQLRGESGEENSLFMETLPYSSLVKTYNTDQQIPDSAGTATAFLAGAKTYAGAIGIAEPGTRGDCASALANPLLTILDMAEMAGMSTGVVSTARVTHATPASAYAKSSDRNWEDDADMEQADIDLGCVDIAAQLIDYPHGDGLEVAMGGGRRSFLPADAADPEDEGKTGERNDGRDLTAEWVAQYDNAAFVWNQDQFAALDLANTDHLLGLFNRSHMQYEADRADDTGGEPSLTEMSLAAVEILSRNDGGFFLLVEGGRVDHGHHENSAYRALHDTVEFDRAIAAVAEVVDLNETLIVVTADHSHVFTMAGYADRGNPILGLSANDGNLALADDGMPYTTVGYANGPGGLNTNPSAPEGGEAPPPDVRADLSNVDVLDVDFVQQALIPLGSETHGGEDVAVFAGGPWAHLFQTTIEQSYIYHVMAHALNIQERAGL